MQKTKYFVKNHVFGLTCWGAEFAFLVVSCRCKERILHVTLQCHLSGCQSVPGPPPQCDFWVAQVILSNFNFQNFTFQFFFHLQKCSHFHFFMHFRMSHAILRARNFLSPKIFLQWAVGEASPDTMLPSNLVFLKSSTQSRVGTYQHLMVKGAVVFDKIQNKKRELLKKLTSPHVWQQFCTLRANTKFLMRR